MSNVNATTTSSSLATIADQIKAEHKAAQSHQRQSIEWKTPEGATMTAATLLDRLNGVRQTGPGRWLAQCPSHDDRRASLSVRELDDGRTLIHCFAECAAADVVAAIGLDLADLFPPRTDTHALKRVPRPYSLRDLVTALGHELRVAFVILSDVANGKPIADADRQRAAEAQRRIAHFLGELNHAG